MARGKSNNVQRLREERLLSKAELARRAGVSVLTIDRVESGRRVPGRHQAEDHPRARAQGADQDRCSRTLTRRVFRSR